MTFRVTFATPVVYQASHPRARRTVTELIVHAPDARAAEIHAIKTVEGSFEGMIITEVEGPLGSAPVVEVPQDVPEHIVAL
jgi:hypothetical protein